MYTWDRRCKHNIQFWSRERGRERGRDGGREGGKGERGGSDGSSNSVAIPFSHA